MKNKNAEVEPIKIVVGLVLLGAVVFIFFNVFFPIITGKQAPFFRGQIDYASTDCDGDGAMGITDQCPCVHDIITKEQSGACPPPDPAATTACPELCKGQIASAKKTGTPQG